MMKIKDEKARQAIKKSKKALDSGNRKLARKWAQYAVSLNPDQVEAWLILAALATPISSLRYLHRALQINPQNTKTLQGIAWAQERISKNPSSPETIQQVVKEIPSTSIYKNQQIPTFWIFTGLIIIVITLPFIINLFIINFPSFQSATTPIYQSNINKLTKTPTPTLTHTATATPKPTHTISPTNTASPSNTPEATKTPKPKSTKKPAAKKTPALQIAKRPKSVDKNESWIDIDLSSQRAFALTGDTLQKSFVVSTGTWMHPTVTGTFSIYIKYHYANMSGPGYFLPNVPYIMYFYKDYGLHGTYWHNNFGTPMSHGCVNFKTKDAAWLFDFASIGTIVNIHR